jgi:hypothetical protein
MSEAKAAPQRTLLGRMLVENAMVSGITGLVLVVGAAGLDTWMGVNQWVLAGVGAGLVAYAVALVVWARSPKWLRLGGLLAVASDVMWVILAAALIFFTDEMTAAGEVALAGVTAVVACLSVAQTVGIVKLEKVA